MGRHHVTIVVNEELRVNQHYEHRCQALWVIEIYIQKYDIDELKMRVEEYVLDEDLKYRTRFYYKDVTKEVITELAVSKF